jgi:hypothetical protein
MLVENRVHPDAEQVAALQRAGADGPIVMLNLLKFRARAAYPDAVHREAGLAGQLFIETAPGFGALR